MEVIKTFGEAVDKLSSQKPDQARKLLRTGWTLEETKCSVMPDKRLMKADRYLTRLMMNMMLYPLQHPETSAIVSIFTPCELLQEAGLHPYNVEGFSSFLSGSCAEREFLQQAENAGISETLCSYHKTFIGAAQEGVLPRPKCIVYTNLACDANLLTFRYLSDLYQVPTFSIDVPLQQTDANVAYVAEQLRDLKKFLEGETGKTIEEDALIRRVTRSKRTLEKYEQSQKARKDKYIPTNLKTPMFNGVTNNVLLGTAEQEHYLDLLLKDIESAGPATGIRLYWMHTIPFWSESARRELVFNPKAQIVGEELAAACDPDFDPGDPYTAMAHRLVWHALNGSVDRRIQNGIDRAKEVNADGAVWFAHWGCKHTLGAAQLAKKKFEEAGIPMLILDGDGCDRSHGGEGQTATRLGAFLEMLRGDQL